MSKFTERLAIGFTLISVWRIGSLISEAYHGGFIGWFFAVLLALSVYASGRGLRDPQTRLAAIIGLIVFGGTDWLANEIDLMRTLALNPVFSDAENFLGISAVNLEYIMQGMALLYGGVQTFGIFNLGWQAAAHERVRGNKPAQKKNKTADSAKGFNAGREKQNGETIAEDAAGEKRRNELSAPDKERISGMNPRQVKANYGGSIRRAREWVAASRDGTL